MGLGEITAVCVDNSNGAVIAVDGKVGLEGVCDAGAVAIVDISERSLMTRFSISAEGKSSIHLVAASSSSENEGWM